jgi:hypothetical protein
MGVWRSKVAGSNCVGSVHLIYINRISVNNNEIPWITNTYDSEHTV